MKTLYDLRTCTYRGSKSLGSVYELYTNNRLDYSFSDFDFMTTSGKIPTEWICVGLVKRCKGNVICWIERNKPNEDPLCY